MPTIYQRLQHYYSLPYSVEMNNKDYRKMCYHLKGVYHKGNYPPFEQIESIEPGGTYTVRNYPERFKKIIDAFIWRHHEKHAPPKPKVTAVIGGTKKRVRKPIKKFKK